MICRLGYCHNTVGRKHICEECFNKLPGRKNGVGKGKVFSALVGNMVYKSKQRNKYTHSITKQDIYDIWPEDNLCPIFRRPFIVSELKAQNDWSPTLDRIDPTKGYHKGNIQILSGKANNMKNNATLEELKIFAKYYINS